MMNTGMDMNPGMSANMNPGMGANMGAQASMYTTDAAVAGSSSENRRIVREVRQALQVFRTLLQDDKNLCNAIDASYEEMLINDLRTVPEQYDDMILESLDTMKIFANNIDFIKISEELGNLRGNFRFEINSYGSFENGIQKLDMSKKDKARILNISAKFKPLFTCVDRLVYKPVELVKRIGYMRNMALGDLF